MYYNSTTGQTKSRYELKALFPRVSLPQDFESHEGWCKLYEGTVPTPDSSHKVESDGVKQVNGKWTQTYKLVELSADELLALVKQRRREEVDALTVTVSGMIFDANEVAQERMSRAVLAHQGETETFKWVLANNTVADITIAQLEEALKMAVARTGRIWVRVYE